MLSLVPVIVLILILFTITLGIGAYSTIAERKIAAYMQDRLGPNRSGPGGIFQPLADGGKMFFKEDFIPAQSSHFLFIMGPCIAMMCALLSGVVIPWGDKLTIFGHNFPMQVADLNVGALWLFAIVSIGVYGIMIGGWASNNKYSLMGAVRSSSQMISYELAQGLALAALILSTGSLRLSDIVSQQHGMHWNIIYGYQPLGFLIFIICTFAECNRVPFDLAECEAELVGGYHTEYSSMKLGFYLFAEYINMFIASAVMSTFYFGGYNFPFMDNLLHATGSQNLVTLVGTAFLFGKIFFFIFFFMWVRWTLPRFRYDQLMNLGWKSLIPLALLNLLLTAGLNLIFHH